MKNYISHNQHFLPRHFGLYQRLSSEEACSVLLPVLATVVVRRGDFMDWPASTRLDRKSDKSTRWIMEAVHIWKEGQHSVNWDEGSYTLSHTYDRFLAMLHHFESD